MKHKLLKKSLLFGPLIFFSIFKIYGQLVLQNIPINTNGNPEWLVQNMLLSQGVQAFNVNFYGDSTSQIGSFDAVNTQLGIPEGIVLSSGRINTVDFSSNVNTSGDDDIELLESSGHDSYDAAILEFDFIATGNSMSFRYVFASEEYCEYVNSSFRDAFGFFISGPGLVGPFSNAAENIGILPTGEPVNIFTVNHFTNTLLFNANTANCGGILDNSIAFDGFTVPLIAQIDSLICGEVYHVKLALADVGDAILDCAVFLERGSFNTFGSLQASFQYENGEFLEDNGVIEGCQDINLILSRADTISIDTININFFGSASINDDFVPSLTEAIFLEGESVISIPLNIINDGTLEGVEIMEVSFDASFPVCNDSISLLLYIYDSFNFNIDVANSLCDSSNGSIAIYYSEDLEYSFLWNTGDTTSFLEDLTAGEYEVTVSAAGCDTILSFIIEEDNCCALDNVSLDFVHTTCDSATGSITINYDENELYSFIWNTGDTTAIIENLHGGEYMVTVSTAVCDTVLSVILEQKNCCTYELATNSVTCNTDTFCVSLVATAGVNNGIVGMNYCLSYDPAIMQPTGNASLGGLVYNSLGGMNNGENVYVNTNVQGYVHSNIFYDAEVPEGTFWSGEGEVICIEFVLADSISPGTYPLNACEVEESYTLGEITSCVENAELVVDNYNLVKAKIVYWDYDGINNSPEKPLVYDEQNPNEHLITEVSNDISGAITSTNIQGSFTWDINNGNEIKITRDITGTYGDDPDNCEDVFLYINGADAYYAALIANFDMINNIEQTQNWIPTFYQMIAGDVNMNDKIRANDVTLILDRSVKNYCEYPQVWNYTEGTIDDPTPPVNAEPSYDWRFIDAQTSEEIDYIMDPTYPVYFSNNATQGYWRDNVPDVPSTLLMVDDVTSECPELVEKFFNGILLGDLNNSWDDSIGVLVKTTSVSKVIFSGSAIANNQYEIYVAVDGDNISASVDFRMDYDESKMAVVEVISTEYSEQLNTQLSWNNYQGQVLYLSSYNVNGITSNENLYKIKFQALEGTLSPEDLGSIVALINGEIVPSEVNIEGTSGLETITNQGFVNIYPNPNYGVFTIELGLTTEENIQIEVYNMLGELVESRQVNNDQTYVKCFIDLGRYHTGLYTIIVSSKNQSFLERILVK